MMAHQTNPTGTKRVAVFFYEIVRFVQRNRNVRSMF